jgi:DNA-binding response OmpR family regulator
MPFTFVCRRFEMAETSTARRKALVVDDDHGLADTLSTILNQRGYVASTAYRGTEALAMARDRRPDLIR